MDKNKDFILVSGATGQQGGAVARQLLRNGYNVHAMTRKPDSEPAKTLANLGAKVVRGDLDDAESLERVLSGAWGAFAVQNTWEAGVEAEEEQGKRFATIAREQGVQHYVYTSVGSAHRDTGIPHFDNKWRVEQRVRELEFPSWTIIRPAFFYENLASPWFKPAIDEGKLVLAIKPETILQMIAVEDIGRFGLIAFEDHEKMNGVELDISGDEINMVDAAEILSSAARRPIQYVQQPIEEVRSWSEDFALMYEWFDAVGYNADIEALEKEYGFRMKKFREWAKEVDWS